ncbi:hypothetical protein LSH36_127g10003 [Paralvinella palmiformis]|uniref:Uncharacterized protein n=1 Tax=Paralvinella palmiformis TaxID=53620 RepID=A0AAD9JWS5_9ANNE|nr:hypothetical protein LSH36_127g10003 [Paralvinella palmiformis]
MVKAFSFKLPGFDSSPDDEQDYDDQDNLPDEEVDPAVFDHLPDHMPCFAHMPQLVIKNGLKVADQLTKILRKTSTIVSAIRKSTHVTDLLEGERSLQTANATSDACDILAPFEEITYIVQRDQTVSVSFVMPSLLELTAQLEDMPTRYHVMFITTLKSSISRHLTPYTHRRKLQCATVLDPRFNLDWCSSADQLVSMKETQPTEPQA